MFKGFIGLFTAKDLFEKLKSDFDVFINDPKDPYKAFNFFVTAEHLPDWIDDVGIKYREPYLRICSHIATGAKHFEIKNENKNSVEGYSVDVYVADGYVEDGYFELVLVVNLTENEAKQIGATTIDLKELALKVMHFWEEYFEGSNAT